jgi:shikimate dehydrogenase
MGLTRLGVIGNPIVHSQSPVIHEAFSRDCEIELSYEKYLVEPKDLTSFIVEFFSHRDAKGLNVTLPFKQDVIAVCDELTLAAQDAGAVNTLIKDGKGKIVGDNTDGDGLIQDLMDYNLLCKNSRILIIGAGGAAKGIVSALKSQHYLNMTIINRTEQNAEHLAKLFAVKTIKSGSISDKNYSTYDLIINTASNGGASLIERYQINPKGASVYDISYGERAEVFLSEMLSLGAIKALDGTGMLINQAAYAFKAWFDVMPDTASAKAIFASAFDN